MAEHGPVRGHALRPPAAGGAVRPGGRPPLPAVPPARQHGCRPSAENAAFNADRLLNRFVHFPRHARRRADHFDLFHVADHTYAQLVHACRPVESASTATTSTRSAASWTRLATRGRGGSVPSPAAS